MTRRRMALRAATTALCGACVGALALAPTAARACGACVEDKIAATYDHAVVQRAAASGDVVVYCEVDGALDRQRLTVAALRVRGIRAQSVRTSAAPAALSFAVDPARLSPQAAVAATERNLPPGTRLKIVHLQKAQGAQGAQEPQEAPTRDR